LNAFMSCLLRNSLCFQIHTRSHEGGVEMGIYPNVAKEVVMQTLKGAIALLEANGTNPEVEVDKSDYSGWSHD